jgi:hypothetical protein
VWGGSVGGTQAGEAAVVVAGVREEPRERCAEKNTLPSAARERNISVGGNRDNAAETRGTAGRHAATEEAAAAAH